MPAFAWPRPMGNSTIVEGTTALKRSGVVMSDSPVDYGMEKELQRLREAEEREELREADAQRRAEEKRSATDKDRGLTRV